MAKQKLTDMTVSELVASGRIWLNSKRVKHDKSIRNDVKFVQDIIKYWDTNQSITKHQETSLLSKLWEFNPSLR